MTKQLFAPSLRAVTAGESRPHVEALRASLRKHAGDLPSADHERIISGFMQDGLARDGGPVYASAADDYQPMRRQVLSPVQAMRRTELHPLLKQVGAQCRRAGFDIDFNSDKPLSVFEIDKAFKAAGIVDLETRFRIKCQLAELRLID